MEFVVTRKCIRVTRTRRKALPRSILGTARWAVLIPALLIGSFALVACGNDDDGGSGGGPGRTASDEDYVRNMCVAMNDFLEDLFGNVMAAMFAGDEEEAESAAIEAIDELVTAMRGMGVPADVRPYHDEMVDQFAEGLAQLRAGGFDLWEDDLFGDDDDIDIPEEISERLDRVAQNIDECEDFDFFG
jgi:hypothetical protein